MSDSTCRNLKKNDMQRLLNRQEEVIERSVHPGATADQLGSYMDWWHTNLAPDRLVLSAGANDLLRENSRCNREGEDLCNEGDIVERIINIGVEARRRGVRDVYICNLYSIKTIYDGYTSRFNDILAKRCLDLGFYVVSNSNIELCDLSDGLHVNYRDGHRKLQHNIMNCCDSYINKRNI